MKGLGKIGFMGGTWQDYAMCLDAVKEYYRLNHQEWNYEIEQAVKHDLEDMNKYECLGLLQKLNRRIKKLGGNIIARRKHEQGK